MCISCHRNVHVSIGNADLERGYDPVESLRNHPGAQQFTEWVKDKPHARAWAGSKYVRGAGQYATVLLTA